MRHGASYTPEYRAWVAARQRCSNPQSHVWSKYGGRGIDVCKRWDSFQNFLADMGMRPSPKHTLDRIDVNGDYSPENCRWATIDQQNNNKTTTRYILWKGRRVPITLAALEANAVVDASVAWKRIAHFGWPAEKAFSTYSDGAHPGEENGRAKLTAECVRSIRSEMAVGTHPSALADRHAVSIHTIKAIRWGRSWQCV